MGPEGHQSYLCSQQTPKREARRGERVARRREDGVGDRGWIIGGRGGGGGDRTKNAEGVTRHIRPNSGITSFLYIHDMYGHHL